MHPILKREFDEGRYKLYQPYFGGTTIAIRNNEYLYLGTKISRTLNQFDENGIQSMIHEKA